MKLLENEQTAKNSLSSPLPLLLKKENAFYQFLYLLKREVLMQCSKMYESLHAL